MKLIPIAHKRDSFDDFNDLILARLTAVAGEPVFDVAKGLNVDANFSFSKLFLSAFPSQSRNYHNCRACLSFIDRYASAVVFDGTKFQSVLWQGPTAVHKDYKRVEDYMLQAVVQMVQNRDLMTNPMELLQIDSILGHAPTGQFTHFHMHVPTVLRQDGNRVVQAREALKRLEAFKPSLTALTQAITLAKTGAINRGSTFVHALEFLTAYNSAIPGIRHVMAAQAGEDLTHPNTSAIGTLLTDLTKGMSIEDAKRKFNTSVVDAQGLQYQRPTAPVAAQQLAKTEQVFKTAGYDRSLHRQMMHERSVPPDGYLWKPGFSAPVKSAASPAVSAMFPGVATRSKSHKRAEPKQVLSENVMTWHVFERDILPQALSIEWSREPSGYFATLTEAFYPDAPPILRWDTPALRNTVSWSFNSQPLQTDSYGISDLPFVPIRAVIKSPCAWAGRIDNHDSGRLLILTQNPARPYNRSATYSGLFPELLASHMHEHKRVIELSNNAPGNKFWHHSSADFSIALGISREGARTGSTLGLFRVTMAGGIIGLYRINKYE